LEDLGDELLDQVLAALARFDILAQPPLFDDIVEQAAFPGLFDNLGFRRDDFALAIGFFSLLLLVGLHR
jgi:hypothetical protein